MNRIILGLSAYYHDSAAALLIDGAITAAAQEERFTRKKHDPGFPTNAVKFCLDYGGITLDDVDAVVFYDKPLLKFERLLETYYMFAPQGLTSFLSAIPVWIKEKIFLKRLIKRELESFGGNGNYKLLFSDHHLSHAASAFYPSPFEEAAILTIDGVGEWATASLSHGKGNRITSLTELFFPHSVGLLYSAFTYYLGFKVNSGEYKLMGLSPYGNPESERTARFREIIRTKLVEIRENGSIKLNQKFFNYAVGLTMVRERAWEKIFGFPRRVPETKLEQHHCDLALAIQQITEEIVLKMAWTVKSLTGAKNLCLAGGVALNCVANGRLLKEGLFENIWIQPAAGDAGGALGAACAIHHLYYEVPRITDGMTDSMQGSYFGPEFSDSDVNRVAQRYQAPFRKYEHFETLCDDVAGLIAEGNVVGWVQGRMEWGPRALGNRSILGDARNKDMQKRLNLKIKFRESFRPFAPSVLYEDAAVFFESGLSSPYMLLVAPVKKTRRMSMPKGYHQLGLREKLYYSRSDIPAVTHLDYSARIQTVCRETNPRYWMLINAFKNKTGYGVIVNTSFNVRGEPIVCTPEDAYRCFMRTEMDILVVGNYIFNKREQPKWEETKEWRDEYVLD